MAPPQSKLPTDISAICESRYLAILQGDTTFSIHQFHASPINEVFTIIIVNTNGLVCVCMWIDNLFNAMADVFNFPRRESAGDTNDLADGVVRISLRSSYPDN